GAASPRIGPGPYREPRQRSPVRVPETVAHRRPSRCLPLTGIVREEGKAFQKFRRGAESLAVNGLKRSSPSDAGAQERLERKRVHVISPLVVARHRVVAGYFAA